MQILNIGSQPGMGLQEMLQEKNELQKGAAQTPAPQADGGSEVLNMAMQAAQASYDSSSGSMMSRNFAASEGKDNSYLEAIRAGLKTERDMVSRQNGILGAGLAALNTLEGGGNYAQRNLVGMQAARRMREDRGTAVQEESERNLEETRDRIEEKAQEAMAPKNAEGNPVPALNAGAEAASAAEAPRAVASAESAPAAETADISPAAPAAPQMDIVV